MTLEEARRLTRQINREPGWHARCDTNFMTGRWYVVAWQKDEEDSYHFDFPGSWYRLKPALAGRRA